MVLHTERNNNYSMDQDLYNPGENDDSVMEDMENSDMEIDKSLNGDAEPEEDEQEGEGEEGDGEDEEGEQGEGEEGDGEEGEGEDEEDEEDEPDEAEDEDEDTRAPRQTQYHSKPNAAAGSEPAQDRDTHSLRDRILAGMRGAKDFDIVPVVAIPYAQPSHALAISEGPKWLLTGGEDGFIRKYDFTASIEGKAPLTVAQKHNLIDSITKAGVIGSYWENEQPLTKTQILNANAKLKESDFGSGAAVYEPRVNPVYSLDVERNGYWCLSGLHSGGISLYTMIYNEGALHHYFHHGARLLPPSLASGHLDAVSVLRLNSDQTRFLSGLWDKTVREWDLNSGKAVSLFKGSTGQISSIQFRPHGAADISFKPDPESAEAASDVDSLFGDSEDDLSHDNPDEPPKARKAAAHNVSRNSSIFMSSSIDGTANIWDARVSGSSAVLKLGVPEGCPPWCMSAMWSNDGDKLYMGRRNSTVEEISIRKPHVRGSGLTMVPNILKRLHFPKISGPVTSLLTMPNDNFLLCGSNDNIRLYNLGLYDDFHLESSTKKRATPFLVIPGHHGGALSNMVVDETGRFMISTSGNRGWGHSTYADVVLVYSIDHD